MFHAILRISAFCVIRMKFLRHVRNGEQASVSPSRYTAKNASNASGFNNDQDESDNIRSITVVFYTSTKSAALESAPFYRLACFFVDFLYITFYTRSKFIKGMEHINIFLIYIYTYARIHIHVCAY